MIPIEEQMVIVTWLLGTGVAIGLGYCLYIKLRRGKKISPYLLDLIFLFLLKVLLFTSLYLIRWGEVRFFYFLLVFFGFYLFRSLLYPLLRGFLLHLQQFFKEKR